MFFPRLLAAFVFCLLTSAPRAQAAQVDFEAQARQLYSAEKGFDTTWPVEFHIRIVEPITFAIADSAKHDGSFSPELLNDAVDVVWGQPGKTSALPFAVIRTPWKLGKQHPEKAEALVHIWQDYIASFATVDYTEIKITQGTVIKTGHFNATANLHMAGTDPNGLVRDDHGTLDLQFVEVGNSWRLSRFAAHDMVTDVRSSKMFIPVTESWLANVPSNTETRLLRISVSDTVHRALLNDSLPPSVRVGPLAMDSHPGATVVDVDGDGWDDLYVWDVTGPATLLRNMHGVRFEDASSTYRLNLENINAAVFADLDNDGLLDVVVGRWLSPSEIRFGRRNSRGSLEFGEPAALASLPAHVATVSLADIDRDGRLDVFFGTADNGYHARAVAQDPNLMSRADANVDALGPGSVLLLNRGRRQFVDATAQSGLASTRNVLQAAFADYNGDGWPDVFVGNDFAPASLYVNQQGHFVDVSKVSGADRILFGMGASWGDFDNDGDLDLYASAMSSTAGKRIMSNARNFAAGLSLADKRARHLAARGNALLRNDTGGFFKPRAGNAFADLTEVPAFEATRDAHWAYSAQFFDADNDGWLDIYSPNGFFTSSLPPADGTPRELCSDYWRGVTLENPHSSALDFGPVGAGRMSFSGPERDKFFASDRGKGFVDLSYLSGLDSPLDGRTFAYADFDHDGALDVVLISRNAPVLTLLQNRMAPAGRHWVGLRLSGDGQASNRDAIGAKVEVSCEGHHTYAQISGGQGFATQNSHTLIMGLGACTHLDAVRVQWPGGAEQRFTELTVDSTYNLHEGVTAASLQARREP